MICLVQGIDELSWQNLEPLERLLSTDRRDRIRRYRVEAAKRESLLAELLLRRMLLLQYGLRELPAVNFAEKGKPAFRDYPQIHFNLSHCRTAVACALDDHPLGVDVQDLAEYRPALARVLTAKERAWVEQQDTDRRFTHLWTLKEAYGKALGCGIAYPMEQTELLPGVATGPREKWWFGTWQLENCVLSLCAAGPMTLTQVRPAQLLGMPASNPTELEE